MTDIVMRRDADLALCVYLEPWLEGRRVLVLGGLDEATLERLPRVVDELELLDEDSLQGELDLPCRTGAFDLVWLVDSALLRPTVQVLGELKRVLHRDGVLVVCSLIDPDPAKRRPGPPETGLARALLPEFRDVHLLRQGAVQSQTFQAIEGAAPKVAVETCLVRNEPAHPERIIAVATDVHLELDTNLWVPSPGWDAQAHQEDPQWRKRLDEATERAHTLSITLDAAEADLEDAFARVRALEAQIAEKDAAAAHEREHRIRAERALEHEQSERIAVRKQLAALEAERDAAQTELASVGKECAALEERLAERGQYIQSLEHDKKHSETVARDLLEELRRAEHDRAVVPERSGRITELEADLAKAAARALEAEVGREAAQMRVDELRASVARLEAQPPPPSVDPRVEGTLHGLRLRLRELEQAIEQAKAAEQEKAASATKAVEQATAAEQARAAAETRASERATAAEQSRAAAEARAVAAEARAIEQESAAEQSRAAAEARAVAAEARAIEQENAAEQARAAADASVAAARAKAAEQTLQPAPAYGQEELSALTRGHLSGLTLRLEEAERALTETKPCQDRVRALERELEEADRFTEAHADDTERIEALEGELSRVHSRYDDLEDELRATLEDLHAARTEVEQLGHETSARLELAQRREHELRSERDHARVALEEARAILAQLTGKGIVTDPSVS